MSNVDNSINLPFSGFYNTEWEDLVTSSIESACEVEIGEDYTLDVSLLSKVNGIKVYTNTSKILVDMFNHYIQDEVSFDNHEIFKDIKFNFIKLKSPNYYNWSSDEIEMACDNLDLLKSRVYQYMQDNFEEFQNYIREEFSDKSGFSSFYSNSVHDSDWQLENLKNIQISYLLSKIISEEEFLEYCINKQYLHEKIQLEIELTP